ncbi:MAG: TlpA disulfide reductase family protein [Nitriliruptoraceae bacterium]
MAPPKRSSARPSRPRVWLVLAAAAVVALAVGVAVLTAAEPPAQTSADVSRPVEVEGAPLPPHNPQASQDPAVGTAAPIVRGSDFAGEPVAVEANGRAQLVAFMASWCPACQQELPHIVEWMEAGEVPADVDLVLVSTFHDETRPNWPPQEWFADEGYTGTVLVDDVDSTVARTFGLSGTPFWVGIDPDGVVKFRTSGVIERQDLVGLAEFLTTS